MPMQVRTRWSVMVLLLLLAFGLVAQATDLRCLVQDHCCCSEEMQDDCKANPLQGPAQPVVLAMVGPVVVPWDGAPPPSPPEELRPEELLPAPRESLSFLSWGLRAPPPLRFSA